MTTAPLSVWHLLAVFGLGFGSLWWLVDLATRDRAGGPAVRRGGEEVPRDADRAADLPAEASAQAGRQLRRVVLISYSLRAVLAVTLYAISYWHWPVLRSMQLPHGF